MMSRKSEIDNFVTVTHLMQPKKKKKKKWSRGIKTVRIQKFNYCVLVFYDCHLKYSRATLRCLSLFSLKVIFLEQHALRRYVEERTGCSGFDHLLCVMVLVLRGAAELGISK